MSSTSATPPATRRIARSYLVDLLAASNDPQWSVAAAVEQLLGRAVDVRHVLRSDRLVLTFDLADDPAGWSTTRPAEPPLAGQQAAQVTGGQVGVGGTDLTGGQPRANGGLIAPGGVIPPGSRAYLVGEQGPQIVEP